MDNNEPKIFTNKTISIATFLGGPIVAGFLISKNFKAFGNEKAALNSIFIGIIFTVLLFAGPVIAPENIVNKIPQALIPTIYTVIISILVEKLQGQKIRNFLANNGRTASNWQAAGYGFLGLLAIATFAVIMIFAVPKEGYEKSINIDRNVILHYSKKIDESKSQKIAKIIQQSGFMEGSEGADLFLDEELMYYRLKFIISDTSNFSDPIIISDFNRLKTYINTKLKFEKQIEILFTDAYMVNDFKLPENDNSNLQVLETILDLQTYQISDFHTIYYNISMPIEEVRIVGDAIKRLKGYFPDNQRSDIIFLNNENNYTIKFPVSSNLWQKPAIIDKLKSTVDYIKNSGIEKPINLILINNQTYEEIQIIN